MSCNWKTRVQLDSVFWVFKRCRIGSPQLQSEELTWLWPTFCLIYLWVTSQGKKHLLGKSYDDKSLCKKGEMGFLSTPDEQHDFPGEHSCKTIVTLVFQLQDTVRLFCTHLLFDAICLPKGETWCLKGSECREFSPFHGSCYLIDNGDLFSVL